MNVSGKWGLRGVCPHGVEVVLFFDELGYVRQPDGRACKAHIDPEEGIADVPLSRKERRALKRLLKQLEEM
jgi:hypothetical protein